MRSIILVAMVGFAVTLGFPAISEATVLKDLQTYFLGEKPIAPDKETEATSKLFDRKEVVCTTWIAGEPYRLNYNPKDLCAYEFTPAEQRTLYWKEKTGLRTRIDCPAAITLLQVIALFQETPLAQVDRTLGKIPTRNSSELEVIADRLSDINREDLCLVFDNESGSYIGFQSGARDDYLSCKEERTLCERYDAAKGVVLTGTGTVVGFAGGAALGTSASGITAVAHSSGAVILTGSGGYIAGTLGTIGATGLAVLTSPAIVGGAALSALTVGGLELAC